MSSTAMIEPLTANQRGAVPVRKRIVDAAVVNTPAICRPLPSS
jgi:hypothetical protein